MLASPTAYHRAPIRAANRLLPRLWRSGLLPPPDFAEATLVAMAERQTRLAFTGDEEFWPNLRVLLHALAQEWEPNAMGRLVAHGSALTVLKERLRVEAALREHPEILERRIVAPVVIVGPMRSGTTRLHRLLAADPRFAHLRLFETMRPAPPPRGAPDRRPAIAARFQKVAAWANPALPAIHPTGAMEPDEELPLLEQSFWGAQIEAQRLIPSFAAWCETQDATPVYRHLKRLLQLIGWARGESDAKPWVLKTPQHMAHVEALLGVFPDARLVFTHRDPVRVVGSAASLAWNVMVLQVDRLDPHAVGREWLRKTESRIAATERARGAGATGPDVRYPELDADWEATIRRLYASLGEPLTPEALAAMRAYLAREAARPRHRAHRYRLEDFGLQPDDVRARLSAYSARYGLDRAEGSPHQGS